MSTSGTPMFAVRATPKGKEVVLRAADLRGHQVYSRPTQVTNCLRPSDFKKGLRLAVLEPREQFTGDPPEFVFYPGTVQNIWGNPDDPIVTILYDGHPWSLDVSFGIKQNACMCIPLSLPTGPKRRLRKGSKLQQAEA